MDIPKMVFSYHDFFADLIINVISIVPIAFLLFILFKKVGMKFFIRKSEDPVTHSRNLKIAKLIKKFLPTALFIFWGICQLLDMYHEKTFRIDIFFISLAITFVTAIISVLLLHLMLKYSKRLWVEQKDEAKSVSSKISK